MADIVSRYFDRWAVPGPHQALARRDIAHWIDGQPLRAGALIPVWEPSTGHRLTQTFEAGTSVVDAAVASARSAFHGGWGRMRPLDRQALIHALADALERHQNELAFLESADVGKPLGQAHAIDMGGAIDVLRYFGGWATKISGRTSAPSAYDDSYFGMTLKQPVGVVACIAPWNFPLQTLIWKIAAALAAGCTIVAKPSEVTPVSTLRLAEIMGEVGFPAGTFNVVNGTGGITGAALIAHKGINKISFTGSTATGLKVGAAAVQNMTRLTLELGGKSPALVCADADVGTVVEGLYNGIFFNAGQVCDATSRAIIDRSIYEPVMEGLVARVAATVIGPGLDPDTFMGPLVSEAHRTKVLEFVDQARDSGLNFAADRSRVANAGFFAGPVIVEDVPSSHMLWREEVFGPVLAVARAEDTDQILTMAQDTSYGLGAAIYSRDLARVMTLARKLDAGTIYVNGHGFLDPSFPFGGLRMSGYGKDMGAEQMEHFLETKTLLLSGLGHGAL